MMAVKRINYIILALVLITLTTNYLFIYSPQLLESRQFIIIPTLAVMISSLFVLIYQLQLQEVRKKLDTSISNNLLHGPLYEPSDIYVQAFNCMPDSVFILDRHSKVIYHNKSACHLFGIEKDKMFTEETLAKESPFEKSQLTGIKNALLYGLEWQGQQTLHINGEGKTYLHHIYPICRYEVVLGIIMFSNDITALIQSRKDAQAANMAKNQFLANVSHELRTPLIGILGAVELLERNSVPGFETENIKIISDCGEQLLEIINKILDVSRMELGMAVCHPVECNIRNILEQILGTLYPSLRDKGLSIDIQVDHALPDHVVVDHDKLQQILLNIIYNAVKFTEQGGIICQLDYTKSSSSSWITISIKDTGIGIPEDQLSKIFSPFTQVDNSASRAYEGTGLGLYLCKELVELMNGELWIESETGKGSTFYIKLPVEDITSQPRPDAENKTLPHDLADDLVLGFTPVNILVVDDNQLTQKIICQILHDYGFQAAAASNGVQCLEMLDKNTYDLILMDMQMPLMDGYETTLLIRSHHEFSSLPVIAITANSTIEAREKCLSCGCNAYIPKPFKAEELVYEINKCLKNIPSSSYDTETDLIAKLIPEFLDSLCDSINDLDTAVKNNDIQEVKSISHDIKGSAGLYGFHEISSTAAKIEQAAGKNEPHAITNSFSQLCDLYKKLGA
ncbi:sensory box histidine kinase/response regulator [hydrocarbon metagenome]|uniref:histidine kinase n=1 Tax=hydrocarbon metagenome TaxID=938273 RepID=A0A0W8E3Q5_9ZZZZ